MIVKLQILRKLAIHYIRNLHNTALCALDTILFKYLAAVLFEKNNQNKKYFVSNAFYMEFLLSMSVRIGIQCNTRFRSYFFEITMIAF